MSQLFSRAQRNWRSVFYSANELLCQLILRDDALQNHVTRIETQCLLQFLLASQSRDFKRSRDSMSSHRCHTVRAHRETHTWIKSAYFLANWQSRNLKGTIMMAISIKIVQDTFYPSLLWFLARPACGNGRTVLEAFFPVQCAQFCTNKIGELVVETCPFGLPESATNGNLSVRIHSVRLHDLLQSCCWCLHCRMCTSFQLFSIHSSKGRRVASSADVNTVIEDNLYDSDNSLSEKAFIGRNHFDNSGNPLSELSTSFHLFSCLISI